jgi:hypothetical protein
LKVEKRAKKVKPRSTASTKQALELVAPFYSELIIRYSVLFTCPEPAPRRGGEFAR